MQAAMQAEVQVLPVELAVLEEVRAVPAVAVSLDLAYLMQTRLRSHSDRRL